MYKTKETAIKHLENGEKFENAPFDFVRKDPEFCLIAIEKDYHNAEHISKSLKQDKGFAEQAAQVEGMALKYFPYEFQQGDTIGRAAIESNAYSLQYCNQAIRDNKDLVKAAVTQTPVALEFASDRLKADKEIVLAAVKKDGWAISYTKDKSGEIPLANDLDIYRAAVASHSYSKQFFKPQVIAMAEMQEQLKPKAPSLNRGMKI
jgi:hypothetical protein